MSDSFELADGAKRALLEIADLIEGGITCLSRADAQTLRNIANSPGRAMQAPEDKPTAPNAELTAEELDLIIPKSRAELANVARKVSDAERVKDLAAEVERLTLLIKIADELITNENAKQDWTNAKRIRSM